MSLLSSWGAKETRDLADATSAAKLRTLTAKDIGILWHESLLAGDISAARNIVSQDPALLNSRMYGFEGHDVYGVVPDNKSGRCYTYTGEEKDGYFYPLHVAAEMGHKKLVILLVQAGADQTSTDYRDDIAENKCNGNAVHAFYELRGLKFEEIEEYEGQYDRHGKRYRQGSVYYKAEGYFQELHLLYRGGWKDDQYSGHGSLYWTGSPNLKYVGRFKEGVFNGSGTLYSQDGEKTYSGQFREGQKEGRGEEFNKEGKMVYKGEFSEGLRHGFGAVYLSEGHRYMGRLDKGVMTGVGVYFHPGGNRFEGNFFNNKPDGHGSFYEVDPDTGRETSATHAMWTMGRKASEINFPFEAKKKDLPALATKEPEEREGGADDDEPPPAFDWKRHLSKCIRLTRKSAANFEIAEAIGLVREDDDEEEEEEEEDLGMDADDVHNFHFVEVPALFVAYSYVTSAAKVFEERKITRDLRNLPDFEVVYQLVLDAVENYNERWMELWQAQERKKTAETDGKTETSAEAKANNARKVAEEKKKASNNKKRFLFMSEAEKKAEILKKHTAELNVNKSMRLLDPEVELQLGKTILAELEGEVSQELEVLVEEFTASGDNHSDVTSALAADKSMVTLSQHDNGPQPQQREQDESPGGRQAVVTNDFAAELLYMMRSAGDMLGD
mmetsp:Transcript_24049/g.40884  ORF Transcript_24049/g.40884 Transcript_24049/m.40884 type:complete len:669 (-) Transcript_24049:93-2099(-)